MSNDKPGGASHSQGGFGGKAFFIAVGALCVVGVLLAIGIIPRLSQSHDVNQRAHAAAYKVPKVIVIKPQPAVAARLTLPGSTLAIEDSQVGARTTGYLTKRYVDIGSHVHAGQVLAEIESPDVDQQLYQANAQVAQARATVQQSIASVANLRSVVAQARASVRQTQANLEAARATLASSQAQLAQLQSAEQTAEAQLGQAEQQVDVQQAALRQANTSMQLAKVTYERYATLLKSGYAALEDVDTNEAAYKNAQAAVNSAQANVNAAVKTVQAATATVHSAQANVRSGEAQVRAAQKNVDAVAETVQAARATVDADLASVRSGQSTVDANRYNQVANQFNSKRMAVLTSFEKVVAPFDGVITARNVDVGALVNSGGGAASGGSTSSSGTGATSSSNLGSASSTSASPSTTTASGLFGIARTDVLRILIPVPQAYFSSIHAGMAAQIAFNEFPGEQFTGQVSNVSGALDATSRTLLAEIHLPNRDGRLFPGMFAQVTLDLPQSSSNGLQVPATAVIFDALGTRVALVGAGNKIHYQQVQVGRDMNTQLEISQGLTPNDTLVASPSDDLFEGEAVNPTFAPPAAQAPAGQQPGAQPGANQMGPRHTPRRPGGGNSTLTE